jgi:arsenate reductase (thioredoxin)
MDESFPRVLFVCVGNAGRSQMAQAFYERRGGEARSAGSRPEAQLHPQVVEAMREVGVDLNARRPKGIAREDVEWAELVVTMGCGDACPIFPGKTYVDWNLPDPVVAPLEEVRLLRDRIERLVEGIRQPVEPSARV